MSPLLNRMALEALIIVIYARGAQKPDYGNNPLELILFHARNETCTRQRPFFSGDSTQYAHITPVVLCRQLGCMCGAHLQHLFHPNTSPSTTLSSILHPARACRVNNALVWSAARSTARLFSPHVEANARDILSTAEDGLIDILSREGIVCTTRSCVGIGACCVRHARICPAIGIYTVRKSSARALKRYSAIAGFPCL